MEVRILLLSLLFILLLWLHSAAKLYWLWYITLSEIGACQYTYYSMMMCAQLQDIVSYRQRYRPSHHFISLLVLWSGGQSVQPFLPTSAVLGRIHIAIIPTETFCWTGRRLSHSPNRQQQAAVSFFARPDHCARSQINGLEVMIGKCDK